jgi:hypothetical protein
LQLRQQAELQRFSCTKNWFALDLLPLQNDAGLLEENVYCLVNRSLFFKGDKTL